MHEYCQVTGRTEPGSASDDELAEQAMRRLHEIILQDLRPPWVTSRYPTQIPGESTLRRYTPTSFLQWSPVVARACFGEKLVARFRKIMQDLGVVDAGLIGRPLYACTAVKRNREGERICMSAASMSPLLEFLEERKAWRCAACLGRKESEPVSDSFPRRILHLYPLVWRPRPLRRQCERRLR